MSMRKLPGVMLASCILLTGCGPSKPFDDAANFQSLYGQQADVGTRLLVDDIVENAQKGAAMGPVECSLAALLNQKLVSFEPRLTFPYSRLEIGPMAHDNAVLIAKFGHRQFSSASEIVRYQREGNDFFAETVHYTIVPEAGEPTPPSSPSYGPFAMRIVYVNDPSVGHWALSSASGADGQSRLDWDSEVGEVLKQLSPAGCAATDIADRVAGAKGKAFDQIEANLKASGQIERGADAHVLVSKASGHAFYTGYADGAKLEGVDQGQAVATASDLCQALPIRRYKNWRLPTPEEFQTATVQGQSRPDYRMFADTPDHRLWSDVHPRNDRTEVFLLNVGDPIYSLRTMMLEPNWDMNIGALSGLNGMHPDIICIADL